MEGAIGDSLVDFGYGKQVTLKFFVGIECGRGVQLDALTEKAMKAIRLAGGIRIKCGRFRPFTPGGTALFLELSTGTGQGLFTFVQYAAGEFETEDAGGVSILPHKRDPTIGQDGNRVHEVARLYDVVGFDD